MNELVAKLAVTAALLLALPILLFAASAVVAGCALQAIWRVWK